MAPVGGTLPTDRDLRKARLTRNLDLGRSRLTTLPPEILYLTKLQALDLHRNQLTSLPPEIGQLTNLQTLMLDSNQLTTLPPEIGQLTNLKEVWLSSNQLTTLPPEIGRLTNLQTLMLNANYRLATLPPEIGQLTNLRSFFLNENCLATLPPEIGQLTNLQEIWLDRNSLTALPHEIFQLAKLQKLSLDENCLATLPPEIGQLTNLKDLWLAANQLSTLPPEIGKLTNLQRLSIHSNHLSTLPLEIGKLANLETLNLKNNQLTMLPGELADILTKGVNLHLDDNPLNEPLPDIISRGFDALTTYLRSLKDATAQYEAKVLLVGEGNVGKTSLIAALRNAAFVEDRPTTHGIEIQPLIMRHPDLDVDMTVRAWDFGGQEVYRITHQFFFSQRALYLVVWNAREGQEQNEVEGWLRRIRLRVSRDARALVVMTHCEERRPELDYPYLERTFPNFLAGHYEVDNLTERGISELREGIAEEAAHLPQMGQLISLRWIAARKEIIAHAETEPQIAYEQFAEICRCHDLDEKETSTLAKLMHDLGQIVYYGDDEGLRDFVVLDPEWLTKAMSYVLEDEPTRQSDGILDHGRLVEIWQDRPGRFAYPAHHHPYFLRLMEKFDVSYRLEDDDYRSLVAQLVPHDRPGLAWDTDAPLSEGIRRLALVCQLSEPVPGLIAWLTVRHHRASVGKHWRNGIFLCHPIKAYASEALIELRTRDQLTVDVRAPSPDLFFNVLRDSIEDLITRRWPGLSYKMLIPCPTRTADGLRCRGQFALDGLLRYRERGGTHYPCLECTYEHDLSELLTGFAQPDLPLQLELQQLHGELAEVSGGVSRLEGGVGRLESYAAQTADSMRRIMRAVSSEITDCPLLFTLTSENPAGSRRLKFYQRHYRLVLWCEHPGYWHPWPQASYSIDQPKDWLVRIGPYATVVFNALQLVVPVAASVANMVLSYDQLKDAKDELQLMTTLVAKLPELTIEDKHELIGIGSAGQLTPAQAEAARALRVLLFQRDRTRAFGNLRRVQAPSGDFLWVCPNHHSDYDPGLPSIR